ncbi:S-layer homology domain-containing protein [Thermoanaerobacterium thermosaccharolyticum]|uniref:S-layer homology domain-containing protein n=1 Tax=Thermoanaerobacterium thermosaccharolyticum TaxID=1517 RepID=UPI0029259366|nr:S-layer homology domain-containing protein [Thermoanaerobacterium sp. CMT5567-10]
MYNKKSVDLSEFADANIISDWAKPSLQWAVSIGIIKGNRSGKLNPLDYITRAEVAAILMRFTENYI